MARFGEALQKRSIDREFLRRIEQNQQVRADIGERFALLREG